MATKTEEAKARGGVDAKSVVLKLRDDLDANNTFSIKRNGHRSKVSYGWVKANPIQAIYEHKLEHLFSNSDTEIIAVISAIDKAKGLDKVPGYSVRGLIGQKSTKEQTYASMLG